MSISVSIWTRVFGPVLRLFNTTQPIDVVAQQPVPVTETDEPAEFDIPAALAIKPEVERIFALGSPIIEVHQCIVPSLAEQSAAFKTVGSSARPALAMRLEVIRDKNIPKSRATRRNGKKRSTDVRPAPVKQTAVPRKVRLIASSTWPAYTGRSGTFSSLLQQKHHMPSAQVISLSSGALSAKRHSAGAARVARKMPRAA